MTHTARRIFILSLSTALIATGGHSALAAGFYLQEHSASAMGNAYAGSTTEIRDASTVYYNPAGMTSLGRGQANVNGTLIVPRKDLNDTGSTLLGAPVGGPDSDDPVSTTVIPSAFAAYPFMDGKVWAGIGFSAPFGLATEYDDTWYGRYDSIKSKLMTYDLQPSVAVKINDMVSLGAGVSVQYATADLTSAVFDGLEGRSQVKGNDTSVGWTAGVNVTPQPGTRIGASFRSGIDHKIEGDLKVTGTAASNENSDVSADLSLPPVATVGFAQDLGTQWTVMVQAQWFGWSSFDELKVVRSNGSVAETIAEDYNDTFNFAVGAAYKWDKNLTVRAGYQYDPTPTDDSTRDTRVPDSDRNWITAGLTYNFDDRFSIDASAAWIFMSNNDISVTRNAGFAAVNAENGDSSIGLVSVGLNAGF